MKFTCDICQQTQKDGFTKIKCAGIEHVEECRQPEKNRVPKLDRRNIPLWNLFAFHIAPGLANGMGGYSYQAIEFIFNLHVDPDIRGEAMDRILIIIHEHRAAAEAKRDHAKP